ncbi:MAG: lipoyl(octanoyl) transferase LipB [Chlorobi bacterium]|nr:lipoyl(octanoyl) transferase LipB [Chlorobiota bacterium]
MTIKYKNLGLIDYKEAWDLQEKLFNQTFDAKLSGKLDEIENRLFFLQHPHVYTLGKSGDKSHLLLNEDLLRSKGADFYHINRGGDITYHGPGQIVGYPIFDLDGLGLSIRNYIYNLEEVIIKVLQTYGVEASRSEGETGVWLEIGNKARARKIAAIGVKISKMVSMHGFAFNINTNLEYFSHIVPCGIADKGVTTLQKELGREISLEEVEKHLLNQFEEVFKVEIKTWGPTWLTN